ncbi:MAG: 5-(carboxyamino)imidazole ribonucleotide mutase [Candidatus Thermoplasmatota archaeon]|jgi:5-(carboxyamino)imidazole ribonucleotide mutase|nr:5-(carboxyamino)imidazole ribonucleotide mutase [Candidatus Thermoplasmatota archaeon]
MAKVGVIMGSSSDFDHMRDAITVLGELGIEVEYRIVSAHRTPDLMYEYARSAQSRGIEVIIAGAGGSAHLPGMTAALTPLPVIGVPIQTRSLNGMDSLLSIVQMPAGIPVATVAIGGSRNAALLAARILGIKYPEVAEKVRKFMENQTQKVMGEKLE